MRKCILTYEIVYTMKKYIELRERERAKERTCNNSVLAICYSITAMESIMQMIFKNVSANLYEALTNTIFVRIVCFWLYLVVIFFLLIINQKKKKKETKFLSL